MDLKPLTSEELDAVRSLAPWIKVLGTGTLASFIVGLWKIFGLYKRLEDVEKEVKKITESNLLSSTRHDELTEQCRVTVDAKIDAALHSMHLKWLTEIEEVKDSMSTIKETNCHLLGELKQITNILNKKN